MGTVKFSVTAPHIH